MRRVTLFLGLFMLLPILVYSQYYKTGVLAGMTVSQVDGDPYKGYYKAGVQGGLYLQKRYFKDFAMQVELKYIQKGSSDGNTVEGTNTYYRMILHYLELPFLAQYIPTEHLVLEAGPVAGVLLYSSEKDENGIMFDTVPFNHFELSGTAGVKYQFSRKMGLSMRFSYSVFRIRKHAGGGEWYLNRGQYNNLFAFGIYYSLSR
jgi:hypothetical protein